MSFDLPVWSRMASFDHENNISRGNFEAISGCFKYFKMVSRLFFSAVPITAGDNCWLPLGVKSEKSGPLCKAAAEVSILVVSPVCMAFKVRSASTKALPNCGSLMRYTSQNSKLAAFCKNVLARSGLSKPGNSTTIMSRLWSSETFG